MRLPGQKVWTPATCLDSVGPRSFLIKSGGAVFQRNWCDVTKTGETPVASQTVVPKETPLPSSSGTVSHGHTTVHAPTSPVPSAEPPSFQPDVPPTGLRTSRRERRPPARFSDYVLMWQSCQIMHWRDETPSQPDFAMKCWRFSFYFVWDFWFVFFFFVYKRKGVTNARACYQIPSLDLNYSWCILPLC